MANLATKLLGGGLLVLALTTYSCKSYTTVGEKLKEPYHKKSLHPEKNHRNKGNTSRTKTNY